MSRDGGTVGCLACDLSFGRRELPGGAIYADASWRVEHCTGPLGVGTLIVKPTRHVEHISDLSATESERLGPLLTKTASVVETLCTPEQVYVCLWSHGPVHVHFVVQPESAESIELYSTYGPALQAAMFADGRLPPTEEVLSFCERAREIFGHRG